MKIVSGGRTGVDRAALDVALTLGIEAGGWCPDGRLAEDGKLDSKYPLKELEGAGYPQRTLQNVIDSDGTLVIYFGYLSGGTQNTVVHAIGKKRPYLLIDAWEMSVSRAAKRVSEFIGRFNIETLNVAGPRASGEPGAYEFTRDILYKALR